MGFLPSNPDVLVLPAKMEQMDFDELFETSRHVKARTRQMEDLREEQEKMASANEVGDAHDSLEEELEQELIK